MALSNMVVTVGLSPNYDLHTSSVGRIAIGKHAVRALTISNNPTRLSTTLLNSDPKIKFMQVFDSLKWEIFHDPSFEFDDDSRQYVERMIDHNIPGGKFNRIHTVVDTYKLLKGQELTDDEFFLASALGWCSQWQHGFILVTDDLIDDGDIRRGQTCWYRLPEVGLIAANDAFVLRNHIFIILRKYFKGKACYVDLRDLFDEVEYQTISGQMIDMITTLGQKNLSKFSLSTNRRILQYKTGYGSFYLPFACALLMAGENLSDHALVKDVLIKMGIYFSVQDDYLDAFGDPKVTGKTGVDIENFKCSWVVTKALELANEEQKKIINENYGINDPEKVAKVKEIYHTLNLQGEYEDYGNKIYEELIKSIETHPNKAVQEALKSFLGRIHKRQK